jgi:hypothetical protein
MRQQHSEKGSFRHAIRRQPKRLIALTSLGLVFAALFASAAVPQSTGTYTASISPASATAGTNQSFTIVITNTSVGTEPLGSVNVTAPSLGVNSIGAVTNVTAPGIKQWTATVVGSPSDTIKLRAADLTSTLAPGEQITASGSARFCTAGSSTWTTAAKESIDFSGTEDLTNSGSEPPLTVNAGAGPISTFSLSTSPTTVTAGDASNLTITAKDTCGNTATSYTGTKALTFAGANAAPNSYAPTVTDNGGTARNFGTSTNIDFSAGVATTSGPNNGLMGLYKAESPNITVSDGTYNNNFSPLAMTVNPAALNSFTWTDQPGAAQTAGTPFDSVAVTAYDAYGNVKTDYGGAAVFSGLGTSPNGDPPVYGFSWSAGVATSTTVTDYKAETTQLTVTDANVTASTDSGTPDTFTVAPAVLNHFTWTDQPNASQTAGATFDSVAVTAYDAFGNVKTNYDPTNAAFSGLNQSPSGCDSDNSTLNPAGTFGCNPIYGFTWSSGVATSTSVKDYKAQATSLIVTDGLINASSSGFTVAPAALNRFTWTDQPGPAQTAGTAFDSVAVTAYDAFGNVKTNYSPPASPFSGLGTSPSGCNADNSTVNPAGTFACNPIYGFSWSNGVATSTTVKDYKAEATSLTVTDGAINATSSGFTVAPNVAAAPPTRFSVQPTLTERAITINDTTGVQVTVEDAFGNPRSGDSVTVAIGTNPSSGTLAGTLTRTTVSGIATFNDLKINNSGLGYTLVATVGSASKTSNAFDIANDVNLCSATGTCSATGDTPLTSATVDAFGVGAGALSSRLGAASAASPTSARLGMTVAGSVPVPSNVCGGTASYGNGFWITTVQSGTAKPSFQVVTKLAKTEVNRKPGNPGATKFDICLGTFNVNNHPATPSANPTCTDPTTSESWKTKDGSCAVFQNGYYWGLVADYQSKVKSCPTSPNSSLFPGVLSKVKTGAGDVVITFCKPYPWDGGGGWR